MTVIFKERHFWSAIRRESYYPASEEFDCVEMVTDLTQVMLAVCCGPVSVR